MAMLRLDKLISDSGLYSRSEAVSLIKQGRVTVDGIVFRSNSGKINPELAQIHIDNELFKFSKFVYLMMNKPQGFVSATGDRHERTVMELLDERFLKLGLFPAGRLDKDTEGFLLLTNDGGFAHKITSPNSKVKKRYFVKIDGIVSDADISSFACGITLADGTKCLPAVLEPTPGGAFVTLLEGKYHQVKRMMASIGKPVIFLKRVAIGNLELDETLAPGQYRDISEHLHLLTREI